MSRQLTVETFLGLVSKWISKTSSFVGQTFGYLGLVLILFVMLYEVVSRYVFNSPTRFALEYSILLQALLVAFSAAFILKEEGHVSVSLLIDFFPDVVKKWVMTVTSIVGVVYCGMLCLTIWKTAAWNLKVGRCTETMGFPIGVIQVVLFAGLLLLGFQFLVRGYENYKLIEATKGLNSGNGSKYPLWMGFVSIILIVFIVVGIFVYSVSGDELSFGWKGIVFGFLMLFVYFLAGMPIFVALGLSGAMGAMLFVGWGGVIEAGQALTWDSLFKYSLLAIPGFILMGNLFFQTGFGNDLFDTSYKWLGHYRGGLLMSAIALGAMFSFICGSAMAGVATIGSVAMPEVESRGYDRRLSLGGFTIIGSLAVLIPPSLLMILYASLTEVSLGYMFFAGFIPGILLSVLIAIYIFIRATFNKDLCPPGPAVSFKEKLRSLKGVIPIGITFIAVFGGIYLGIWSAVEAASGGALLATIMCIAYRRLTWSKFLAAIYSTLRICSMVYMIIMAASFLNYFVFVSKFDEFLLSLVTALHLPNWGVIMLILLIMTIMGCVFDVIALIMVSIPIFLPIVVKAGFNEIWFGIIVIIASELALITPPVGVNLYIIKDLAPEGTTTMDVAMGAIPYVAVVWVMFILLTMFPQIALWLPSLIRGA